MNLQEWTRIFLKQRDIIKRDIVALQETDAGFLMKKKDGSESLVIIQETLDRTFLERKPHVISCLNTKRNVETLIQEWQAFSAEEHLLLVFANPSTNEKWLLKPYHHGRVADEESLEQGLLAMHEAITII